MDRLNAKSDVKGFIQTLDHLVVLTLLGALFIVVGSFSYSITPITKIMSMTLDRVAEHSRSIQWYSSCTGIGISILNIICMLVSAITLQPYIRPIDPIVQI